MFHAPVTVKSNNLWLQTPINLSDKFHQKLNTTWHKFYIIPYVSTKKKFDDILIVAVLEHDVASFKKFKS